MPQRLTCSLPAASGSALLRQALHAAIAARHTAQLRSLLLHHGALSFADALAALTQRQQADILSLLPPQERAEVYRHLPASARRQWLQACTAARPPLRHRMLCACQRHWQWLRHTLGLKHA